MDFRRVLSSFLPAVLALLIPANALAQGAWVPRKGEGVFSITSRWLEADKHLVDSSGTSPLEEWIGIDYDSNSVDWGSLETMAVVLDADVGVTDRLAVTGGLAFIAPRYTGNLPDGPGDDGDFHGSIQDARIGARFVAVNEGPWAVTPFAAFVFPTTDYAVRGHTAPGLGLKELQVGATVGRLIDIGDSPRLWLQGAYYYAFMENVSEEVKLNRSNLILDLGYVFNKRLSANLQATWQKVHGGIEWSNVSNPTLLRDHYQAAATHDWRWGGGVSFQVSEAVEVYGSINTFLWGVNTQNAMTFSFGVNVGTQLWGGGGLGVWQQEGEGPDEDMDDWLLEDFED